MKTLPLYCGEIRPAVNCCRKQFYYILLTLCMEEVNCKWCLTHLD